VISANRASVARPGHGASVPGIPEQFTIGCVQPAVAEDEPGKEAEAGDPLGSSMQADAARRRRRSAGGCR
ncbi:MAG TPA: hypothetical protein VNA25_19940, partial [Phycisphaerae bacterium]|nr:hypothetical protein [Phycisphaerae bacterium]